MSNSKLLIRDDGMLYPNTPNTRKLTNFRPYHGDPKASRAERLKYLDGQYATADQSKLKQEAGDFDLDKANKAEMMEYALSEYGKKLDARKNEDALRTEIKKLAEADLIGGE